MARPKINEEQKKKEGAQVQAHFERAQKVDPLLTVDVLANQLGVSQGLVSQWFTGATNIADKRLFALGLLLDFDAISIRPDLAIYRQGHGVTPEGLEKPIDQFKVIPKEDQEVIAALIARAYKRQTKPE